ncbi:hypothetical protein [Bosea sp. Root483D1]|nr:hypothetical protein [Bosea sp. Root483D1]
MIILAAQADADIALRLSPGVVAELEAMLARANQEQAKRLTKQ